MNKITILLADDHVVTRQGLRLLLENERDFAVVGEAGDGQEAVRLVNKLKPDVVVMDIAMPKLNGIEATKQIRQVCPSTVVLILSAYGDDEYIFGLLKAGAAGYLLKQNSGEELTNAIRAVKKGEPVLDTTVARRVINYFQSPGKTQAVKSNSELSKREADILKLAAKGMNNQNIADALHLSKRTIEGHLRTVFNKLGVSSRTEAVLYGLRRGWFTLEDLP